jgi:hypothetical protein
VKHFVANPAYNTPNIIIIAASPPKSTTGTGFSPVSRLFVAQYKLQACFLGKYGVFSGGIFLGWEYIHPAFAKTAVTLIRHGFAVPPSPRGRSLRGKIWWRTFYKNRTS